MSEGLDDAHASQIMHADHAHETPKVTLTERAAFHVKRLAAQDGAAGQALRLAVAPGGCSGFSYDLLFDSESRPGDQVYEYYGVQIRVDAKSLAILKGTEIDFVEGIQGAGFQFKNPQATSGCGCGKSFNA